MASKQRILSTGRDLATIKLRNAVLAMAGYEVVSPATIEEVPDMCAREPFDLVVLGHSITRAERVEVIRNIRAVCSVPILSLYTAPGTRDRLADCEVNALEGPEALLQTMRECIESQSAASKPSPKK